MNGGVQRGRLQLASYVLQGAVKLRPRLLYRLHQTVLRHPAVAYVATFFAESPWRVHLPPVTKARLFLSTRAPNEFSNGHVYL